MINFSWRTTLFYIIPGMLVSIVLVVWVDAHIMEKAPIIIKNIYSAGQPIKLSVIVIFSLFLGTILDLVRHVVFDRFLFGRITRGKVTLKYLFDKPGRALDYARFFGNTSIALFILLASGVVTKNLHTLFSPNSPAAENKLTFYPVIAMSIISICLLLAYLSIIKECAKDLRNGS